MNATILEKLIDWFVTFNWLSALSIIIGPIGVIAGIVLNEKYRRKEKRLIFGERYLEKKVELNERLYKLINGARDKWSDIIEKNPTNKETIKKLYSDTTLNIANFMDANSLYINKTITMHIMFALLGLLDYPEMGKKEKKTYEANTRLSWKQILEAIREDLGFKRIDSELKSLDPVKGELKSMEEYLKKFDNE